MLIVMPCKRGPARRGSFEVGHLGLLFTSQEVLGSRATWFIVLRDPLQIGGPPPS
jgi:hypothetical protein